eukprot:1147447-Pelagomonas_calceolata.AAC.7
MHLKSFKCSSTVNPNAKKRGWLIIDKTARAVFKASFQKATCPMGYKHLLTHGCLVTNTWAGTAHVPGSYSVLLGQKTPKVDNFPQRLGGVIMLVAQGAPHLGHLSLVENVAFLWN